MGEETMQIASRYTLALDLLARLGAEGGPAAVRGTLGDALGEKVRDALEAVAAVFQAGTQAVRDWPEQRRRVLAQVERVRGALGRRGGDEELRRAARALVEAVEGPAGAKGGA